MPTHGVQTNRVEPRELRRQRSNQDSYADGGLAYPSGCRNQAQQNRFGQHLPDDSPSCRAKSKPDSHLTLPCSGIDQEKIRNIDTCDQENQPNCEQKRCQQSSHAACDYFSQRRDRERPASGCRIVAAIFAAQGIAEDCQLRLRLLQSDSWFQSCDDSGEKAQAALRRRKGSARKPAVNHRSTGCRPGVEGW